MKVKVGKKKKATEDNNKSISRKWRTSVDSGWIETTRVTEFLLSRLHSALTITRLTFLLFYFVSKPFSSLFDFSRHLMFGYWNAKIEWQLRYYLNPNMGLKFQPLGGCSVRVVKSIHQINSIWIKISSLVSLVYFGSFVLDAFCSQGI